MSVATHRIAIVTGAASGIGLACAKELAARGWRVFGTTRRNGNDGSAPAESFAWVSMNVDSDESVREGIKTVLEQAGRIDLVVNAAGFGLAGAVEDTAMEEAKAQFETNLFGAWRVCRAMLPAMRDAGSGMIINIGSLAGVAAIPFQGTYSASKAALASMSEALRMEVRRAGIRVVLIEAGDHKTGFTERRKFTAASGDSIHAPMMKRAVGVMEHDEQNGPPPENVARLVCRLAGMKNPRLRYAVGPAFERLLPFLKAVLPQKWFEWAMAAYFKI